MPLLKLRICLTLLFAAACLAMLPATSPAAENELRWSRELPGRQTKWRFVRDMQTDSSYRPAAAGDLVFIGCEHNGALLAVDARSGEERWRYYSGGALRTQPAADEERVLFGSDDGNVYCLDHAGKLLWKAPLGKGDRFVIGHQRLTSAWPAPTHPLLADGKLFILGGCWPADGVYMNAFDAKTGELLWKSPSVHMRAMMIPHWIDDGKVHVRTYSGTGGKALRFDIETGEMSYWPKGYKAPMIEKIEVPGTSGLVGSNAASDLVFGTNKSGVLFCAGPAVDGKAKLHRRADVSPTSDHRSAKALIAMVGKTRGYALVTDLVDGAITEALLRRTELNVVAVDSDAAKVERIRRKLDQRGCFDDHRLTILSTDFKADLLPPYFANLIVSETGMKPTEIARESLRPYGGEVAYRSDSKWITETRGPLAGAGDWSHEYGNAAMNNSSADSLLKAPLGVLWYGGPASARKYYLSGNRPAGALVVNGRMFLQGDGVIAGIDAYTGRLLWEATIPEMHIYNGTHSGGGGGLKDSQPWEDAKAAAKGIPPVKHARATGFNWAAADDCIYLFAADECLRINPETGESLPSWKMPLPESNGESLCWGCPRIMGDLLVATAFRPQDMHDARIGVGGNGGDWTGDRMPMSHVFAVERGTGKLIWSQAANLGFNNRAFVASKNRVFVTDLLQTDAAEGYVAFDRKIPDAGASLRVFDLKSGTKVWKKPLEHLIKYLTYDPQTDTLYVPNRYGREWTGTGWGWPGLTERETRSKSGRPNGLFRAFRGETGELLWEVNDQHYDGPFSVIGGKILNRYGTAFDPATGKLATRVSPLTGLPESFGFKKQGCAVLGGCDSLVAWRTAYHDMATGSSTQLRGFEAGCTTSLLPASGILNLPNFGMFHLRARTAAAAMAHRPGAQPWSSFQWTKTKTETPFERIGFNLGAPGDRYDEQGTLWLQAYRGGDFRIVVEPREATWFATGGKSDWIRSSGVQGAAQIRLPTALDQNGSSKTKQTFDIRLIFSHYGNAEHIFDVAVEGETVLTDLVVARRTEHLMKNVEVIGMLDIDLTAKQGTTFLSGVELIARKNGE